MRVGSAARIVLMMTFSVGCFSMYSFQAASICSWVNADNRRCGVGAWVSVLFAVCWVCAVLFIIIRGMLLCAGGLAGLVGRGVYATLGSAVVEIGCCACVAAAVGAGVVLLWRGVAVAGDAAGLRCWVAYAVVCCVCAGLGCPPPPVGGLLGCSSSRHIFINVSSTMNCLFDAVR